MSQKIYPRSNDKETVYLKSVITNPNIIVGDYTIYNDFAGEPKNFEKNNVLYQYPVNRDKLLNGLLRACEKRPVSLKCLEQMVDQIEQKLKNSLEGEVSSQKIGELAMEQLRQVDQVAYVRFASVYREFQDINSFMDELRKILEEKESENILK